MACRRAWWPGADYILSDATTRNLDLLQQDSTFAPQAGWHKWRMRSLSGAQQANGFALYGELAPLSADDVNASPDASGDAYQQALLQADQTFGQLLAWLGQQGLLQHTLIALTTSQAQANHTDADNYYGMGAAGQGTSKQTLLALSWPGGCKGTNAAAWCLIPLCNGLRPTAAQSAEQKGTNAAEVYSSFVIAPILMHVMGLPAPAEARLAAPGGCV